MRASGFMKVSTFVGVTLLVGSSFLGCGFNTIRPKDDQRRKDFFFPTKQLAEEPVYGKMTYAYLPSPLPERSASDYSWTETRARMRPQNGKKGEYSLMVRNEPLETVALRLAKLAHLSSYCSSLVADRRVTISTSGSIDEIAQAVAKRASIKVVVDRSNREIRFLDGQADENLGANQNLPNAELPSFNDSNDQIPDESEDGS